jgi:hypothetical protein
MEILSRFYPVRCSRTVAEQRYIRAKLDLWKTMPEAERNDINAMISQIARGSVERSALTAVLLRNMSPRTAAERYRLDHGRVYQMQREFLEQVRIWG